MERKRARRRKGTLALSSSLMESGAGTREGVVSCAASGAARPELQVLEERSLLSVVVTTSLTKDINPGSAPSSPTNLTNVGGTLFFRASDANGAELWKSDGTSAGTGLVRDINPGSAGSNPSQLTNVGGTLFFRARDANGYELWKSDGTSAGTGLVKDIYPGSGSSMPSQLTNVGGTLFFQASDANGQELWKSDGTSAGTVLVKDIIPGSASSYPRYLTNVGGTLFFVAGDANGSELWESDGTSTGTGLVRDINPGSASSNLTSLTNVGGTLFFRASDANGSELWKSDGTAAGTVLVKDINPGSGSSNPSQLTNVGGTLFFRALDANGYELWKSDGTAAGTVLVKDINPGPGSSYLTNLTNVGGTLFFQAFDTNGSELAHGRELWTSDGTAAGTGLVKDINPGSADSTPASLTNVGGTLFFSANDGSSGAELWTAQVRVPALVKDINTAGTSSNPRYLTNVGGTLFFRAQDANGYELWKSDGTLAGTGLVRDINPGSVGTGPTNLMNVGGTLFFQARDANGAELWKSDGTAAGTVLVKDINPGSGSSNPSQLTNVGGTLFFGAIDANGSELWKSDGTAAGTGLVKDIRPGSLNSYPRYLTNVGGTLFFRAQDANGSELWKSDGTSAGTVLVRDIYPGSAGSNPSQLMNVGGTLFFQARDANGYELWKSDGTTAGTGLVKDIYPGSGSSNPNQLTNVGGTLFFRASDGSSGAELWGLVPDLAPPTANITTQPPVFSNNTSASFSFTGTDDRTAPGSLTFQVSLDGGGFNVATSPVVYTGLAEGTHTFRVEAIDQASKVSAPATYTWVVDATAPVVTNPGNQSTPEGGEVHLPITAIDGDGDTPTYGATGLPDGLSIDAASGLISGTATGIAAHHGPYAVTVSASDGANIGTASFTWTVTNVAPTAVPHQYGAAQGVALTVPAPGVLAQVTDPGLVDETIQAVLETGPAHAIAFALHGDGSFSYTSDPNYHGADSFTFHATDGLTPSAVVTVTLNVGDTTPPSITDPGPQTSTEGTALTLPITAVDHDGDTLTYSATGLPDGLSINAETGVISGMVAGVAAHHGGPYAVVVTASEGANAVSTSFDWTIENVAPTAVPHQYGASQGVALTVAAPGVLAGVTDPGLADETIQAVLETGPAHAIAFALHGDGSFSYTSDPNYHGADSFTFHATDGLTPGAVVTVALNVGDTTPPSITNPGPQTTAEGVAVSLPITAVDHDGDTLTYGTTGLPDGLSIDPNTGVIRGTPGGVAAHHGPYAVTVSASEGTNSVSTSFDWTVENVAPTAVPHQYGVNQNAQLVVAAPGVLESATDPGQANETLTAVVGQMPSHGTLVLNGDGSFTYTPSPDYHGPDSFTFRVTDGLDARNVATVMLDVGDITAPVVTNPGNQSTQEGVAVSLPITATDADGDTLSYSATGLPDGLGIDAETGRISGTPSGIARDHGPYDVTVSASDGANLGTASFTWSVTIPATTTALASSHNPSTYGQSVTFTATVTANSKAETDGTVTFLDGDTILTSNVPLDSSGEAFYSTPTLHVTASPHAITARYSGSPDALPSVSDAVSQVITPAPLAITADDAHKTYGDDLIFAGTAFTIGAGGLVNGDTIASVTLSSLGAAATTPVGGSPYAITASKAVPGPGTELADYDITYVDGRLTVNKAMLTVRADDKSRPFGTPNPPLTASYSGFKNGENLATSGVTGAPYLSTSATISSPADRYTITIAPGTLSAGNYDFGLVPGTLTVTPADRAPTATVGLDTGTPGKHDTLKATATKSDADGAPVRLTFVWQVNGVVVRTFASATALSDNLDLKPLKVKMGDVIVVAVTPFDGSVNGATVSATAVVVNGSGKAFHLVGIANPGPSPAVAPLTQPTLVRVVDEALSVWRASGLRPRALNRLRGAQYQVADLPGTYLGEAYPGLVLIDRDAAGYGWYIDASAAGHTKPRGYSTRLAGHADLLTTVLHEMGEELGLLPQGPNRLMSPRVPLGVRRLPRLS